MRQARALRRVAGSAARRARPPARGRRPHRWRDSRRVNSPCMLLLRGVSALRAATASPAPPPPSDRRHRLHLHVDHLPRSPNDLFLSDPPASTGDGSVRSTASTGFAGSRIQRAAAVAAVARTPLSTPMRLTATAATIGGGGGGEGQERRRVPPPPLTVVVPPPPRSPPSAAVAAAAAIAASAAAASGKRPPPRRREWHGDDGLVSRHQRPGGYPPHPAAANSAGDGQRRVSPGQWRGGALQLGAGGP